MTELNGTHSHNGNGGHMIKAEPRTTEDIILEMCHKLKQYDDPETDYFHSDLLHAQLFDLVRELASA